MGKLRTKSGNVVPDTRSFVRKKVKHLYVVANRVEAVFYQGTSKTPFQFLRRFSNPRGRLTELQLDSDQPGRGFSSAAGGTIHHALDQRHIHHEKVAQDFAAQLAHELDTFTGTEDITDITLVAEPHFLGFLRHGLSSTVKNLVKHEINREFTQMSDHELYDQIQTTLKKRKTES